MKHIVVAKDHFSGFVALDAIDKKTPAKVSTLRWNLKRIKDLVDPRQMNY